MSYEIDKMYVLEFFQNHILKYIISDLESLEKMNPKADGTGACTIPQAIATFSALDLLGYLVHSQEVKPVRMTIINLLKNQKLFPSLSKYSNNINFFESFKDNVRSVLTHRFCLTKFDITKQKNANLFFEQDGVQVFNVSIFTDITISAILKIYNEIENDTFLINGYSNKEKTVAKMKERIEKLKIHATKNFTPLVNIDDSTTTVETTPSISR